MGDLKFGQRFNVHVVSIIRGTHRINIPNGNDRIYPRDRIQVIGTDEQIGGFSEALGQTVVLDAELSPDREMQLKQFLVAPDMDFAGKRLKDSGVRDKYHCMIVGFESANGMLEKPDADRVFRPGDVVWVVGEKEALAALFAQKKG